LAGARVPPLVGLARLDDDSLARAGLELLPIDLQADLARDDLEDLDLARMDVRGGDEAVGIGLELDQDVLAVRVGSGLEKRSPLAGTRVVESVALADHRNPPVPSLDRCRFDRRRLGGIRVWGCQASCDSVRPPRRVWITRASGCENPRVDRGDEA